MQQIYRKRFDRNIIQLFTKAVQVMRNYPHNISFFLSALYNQRKASKLRLKHSRKRLEVPPLLIISITKRCNLNCTGCYSKLLHHNDHEEITSQQFESVLNEAHELGISIILLAGGEPLVRRDILDISANFSDIIFPIFTNGQLLNDDYVAFFSQYRHLIPVVSIEGGEVETDFRRGEGVYENIDKVIAKLNDKKVLWGISITLTAHNFADVLTASYARALIDKGCRLFFYVEYVPIASESENLVLSDEQKAGVQLRVDTLMADLPAMFVAFPGDEDQYDGCLAAGRGFLHINPSGKVEPCPFAPYSDTDLRYSSLREALNSEFLASIRSQHTLLKEGKGGCALWANRELIEKSLIK